MRRPCATRVASVRAGEGKRSEFMSTDISPQAERHWETLVRADLRLAPYTELARVTCTLRDGVLTLNGSVSSYYLKQIAQRIVLDRLERRATVVNELEVES
jgi:hypothetical protein